jgi:UDP:flavonoid glycosyltransferase YjiC (YdhE family)
VRQAVEKVFADDVYRKNVKELAREFSKYDAYERCSKYISSVGKKANVNSYKATDNSFVIPFSS